MTEFDLSSIMSVTAGDACGPDECGPGPQQPAEHETDVDGEEPDATE